MRNALTALAAVIAAATLLAGCTATPGPPPTAPGSVGDDVVLDLGFGHVHELQIDPATGTVYAATHYGLWLLPPGGGDPVRVGDEARDVMGFAIAGAGQFLGSGHPDPRSGGPANVGLIRSTDQGLSWDTVALDGEVDFHALTTAGGTVHGWDATTSTVLSSTDGGTTFTRGAVLSVTDLLAHPIEPGVLLAATETGLQESDDDGSTFTPVQPQPPTALTHLAATGPTGGVLTGLDADGTVWMLGPDGWQTPGALPAPTPVAFTATTTQLWAATDSAVLTSTDAGTTWTTIAALG
ncbi:hypothetical protein GCM10027047_14380 [Rhodococcus aerolatus]